MYYHEFSVGYNPWFVVCPLMIAFMAYIGWHNVHLKRGKIRRRYNHRLYGLVSVTFALITSVMVAVESGSGLIQHFNNGLEAAEDPIYSIFGAGLAVIGITLLEFALCYGIALVFERLKASKLRDTRPALQTIRSSAH